MNKSKWTFAVALSLAALLVACTARMAVAQATSQPSDKAAAAPADKVATDPVEDFINKTKNPIPGILNWGMDLRNRWEYLDNTSTLNKEAPNHETSYFRFRGRWWAQVNPIKDFEFNIKLTWEGRCWTENEPIQGWDQNRDQVLFDQLNVKYKNAFGLPMTITAGRQDIHFGDDWLVGDGTPLDGSRTFYVDGIRIGYDLKEIKTTADVMYFETDAKWDDWFPRIANKKTPPLSTEQDEQGVVVYVTNKSLARTQIDGYFIYKRDRYQTIPQKGSGAVTKSGDDADIYTFGNRIAGDITDNWKYRTDIAGQFGHISGQSICALGSNDQISYNFNDKYKNQLFWDYEFESGDDPGTKGTNEHFDILWGRWPRWTEGYGFTYGLENRIWDQGNTHRVGPGWQANPTDKLELYLRYNMLFADENTYSYKPGFSKNGCFRGQQIFMSAKYTFNKHLAARVLPEFFFPGDYYTDLRNDPLVFLRLELVMTW
jgi:hypothetical protein